MSLYETPATAEVPSDDLSNYYASPKDGGVRVGFDKVCPIIILEITFPQPKD